MGRLLKKKPIAKKKKRIDGPEGTDANGRDTSGEIVKKTPPRKFMGAAGRGDADARTGLKKPNFIDISIQFLREVKAELKKVTWPSRKQTMGSTAVVIILVMAVSFFLGLVDMGLSWMIRWVFNSLGA